VPQVPEEDEPSSIKEDGSTLTRCELESMSREQVLRLLARQRDEITRREAELSHLNSGEKLTPVLTVANKRCAQGLNC